jgi:dihydropteroate synthase
VIPRLLRLDTEADSLQVGRLIGAPQDSELRGWAALMESQDVVTTMLFEELGRDYRVRFLTGEDGIAFVGSITSLRWMAMTAAGNLYAAAAGTGAVLRGWTNAIEGRPPTLALRDVSWDWSRPLVMGVVNVTPDSFSDGNRFLDPSAAIEHGLKLVAEGADLLDVGGESTRPRGRTYGDGAVTIAEEDEIARIVPVIRGLRARTKVPISVDTRKAAVAEAAIEAGAEIVNDVTGLLHDPRLADVVRRSGAALVLMHVPADIEELTHELPSEDILGDVLSGLGKALERAGGLPRERLILDPGIGFGKTAAHNLYLLRHLESIRALGYPVLVGASRKAFLARAAAVGAEVPAPADRLGASVGAAVVAMLSGAHIVRAHDVRETVRALWVAKAVYEDSLPRD